MLKILTLTVCLVAAATVQACSSSGAAEQGPVPGTYTETDQPITAPTLSSCIVVFGLLKIAIDEGRAEGDAVLLEAAGADYRARLKAMLGDDEANQMIGSSVAFFDELPWPSSTN